MTPAISADLRPSGMWHPGCQRRWCRWLQQPASTTLASPRRQPSQLSHRPTSCGWWGDPWVISSRKTAFLRYLIYSLIRQLEGGIRMGGTKQERGLGGAMTVSGKIIRKSADLVASRHTWGRPRNALAVSLWLHFLSTRQVALMTPGY